MLGVIRELEEIEEQEREISKQLFENGDMTFAYHDGIVAGMLWAQSIINRFMLDNRII